MKLLRSSGKPKKPKLFIVRQVAGESMLPTLRPGQLVIAANFFNRVKVNDIVIIRHEGKEKIKRITYLTDSTIFVVGDNQRVSTDSRHFGPLEPSALLGKVIWPLGL